MATAADLAGQVATAVEAALAVLPARASDDTLRNLDSIAAGAALYQLRMWVEEIHLPDANQSYDLARFELYVFYRLAGGAASKDYLEGDAATDQKTLVGFAFWTDLPAAFEIAQGPQVLEEPRREGNVISYMVGVRVRVTPS
jgi:hypothetical protein